MIPLAVCGRDVLVFDIEHVQLLRQHGFVGVLTGSLPKAPQQNVFLGLPLRLSPYEALCIVKQGLGILVEGSRYHQLMAECLLENSKENVSELLEVGQDISKDISLSQETASNVGNVESVDGRIEILPGVEYVVVNDTYKASNEIVLSKICKTAALSPEDFIKLVFLTDVGRHLILYSAFSMLRLRGYFLMPGLRFGGDFVAYPGDPLKFHSHLIVKAMQPDQKVDLLQLITSGRLATAVKKAWVLMGETEEREEQKKGEFFQESKTLKCFSVEWAGFG